MGTKKTQTKFHPTKTLKRIWSYYSMSKGRTATILLLMIVAISCSILSSMMLPDIIVDLIQWTHKDGFLVAVTNLKLWGSMGVILSLYVCNAITIFFSNVINVKLSQNIGFFIRRDAFDKLQKLPFSYLDSKSVGDLTSRLTNDIDVVVMSLSQNTIQLIQGLLTILGIFIAMMLESVWLTLISVAAIIILFSAVFVLMKVAQPYFRKQQELVGDVNSLTEEYISGHKVVNMFSYEEKSIETFSMTSKKLGHATARAESISRSIFPYNNFINNALMSLVIVICFVFIIYDVDFVSAFNYDEGQEAYKVTFTFILLIRQFTTPISTIMSVANQLQLSIVGASRAFEVIYEKPENDSENPEELNLKTTSVEFKDVVFSYNKNDPTKKIIKGLSFKAKSGSSNAIVGPTGSGKTTIISLLTRFYDLDSGSILIDGKNIQDYKKKELRKNITVVLQDSFLFSQSIKENIRYGRLDATDEEIIKAAKLSNAWKFIEQLPNGIDTVIDEEKDGISEGQKQLISIARAFLSNAKIIILDEATSYVDTKTEKDIQEGMFKLMKSRTSFTIAHRLSTIKDSDNIIVLKDGVKIEEGNHKKLMKEKGFYYKMSKTNDMDELE